MALTHRLDAETGIFEIDVDGPIDRAAYHSVVRDLDAEIRAQGRVAVLETVHRLGWINPLLWVQDLRWTIGHMGSFSRVALLTDMAWLAALARSFALVMPIRFRSFRLEEREAARLWLTGE